MALLFRAAIILGAAASRCVRGSEASFMRESGRASAKRSHTGPGEGSGHSAPLGATPTPRGVNFSVFSRHATGMEVLLFDRVDDARPARTIRLDPVGEPHLPLLARLRAGTWRRARSTAIGPRARSILRAACVSTPTKVLLDPYGRGVVVPEGLQPRRGASRDGDNAATAMKSVVVDPSALRLGRATSPLRRPVGADRSSTRCTCAASRAIRAPAWPRRRAAPTPG